MNSAHSEIEPVKDMAESLLGSASAKIVSLTDWMAWALSNRIVLPMIQRGSVWTPHKQLDLWDTLLRGMPMGALMAAESTGNAHVKSVIAQTTRVAEAGDIDLIDGQQRTLAMLAGWPKPLEQSLRPVAIWLDPLDTPQNEYVWRLWITTKNQPFGYARASAGGQTLGKLERHKLRLANHAWQAADVQALWNQPDFMPWEAKFAIRLTDLLSHNGSVNDLIESRLDQYKKALQARLEKHRTSDPKEESARDLLASHFDNKLNALEEYRVAPEKISALNAAREKVFACQFPVIRVRRESFNDTANSAPDQNIDPPLAILFKRVGTGGEPLSNADYVYSVIKHHAPAVHDTVEALLKDEAIGAIYTPTTLVMSAVRLTMLRLNPKGDKAVKIADSARLDKAAFARLIRNHPEFIKTFEDEIGPEGQFTKRLKALLKSIRYNPESFDKGLPKHALSLIKTPLLEVVQAWQLLKNADTEISSHCQLEIVRFLLQGYLCVIDPYKASEISIRFLQSDSLPVEMTSFPDRDLMKELCDGKNKAALPQPSPASLEKINHVIFTPEEPAGLRGWTRFATNGLNITAAQSIEVYKRWWHRNGSHIHPMLLWLQRDYVYNKFEKEPALAGMLDETPYDYDHILPSAQWANWTGTTKGDRFIDFPPKKGESDHDTTGHWYIGNGLGNIHVLESGENRSLGDESAHVKLGMADFPKDALISSESIEVWTKASHGNDGADQSRKWDENRALAFQTAVEQRTFDLYKKFYMDLGIEEQAQQQ